MMIEKVKWVSSLEKVFPGKEPGNDICSGSNDGTGLTFFKNEQFSVQFAFLACARGEREADVSLKGPFAKYAKVREVCLMPSRYAGVKWEGDEPKPYEPGLYPDLLREPAQGQVRLYPGQWHSLWISIDCREAAEGAISDELPTGTHKLEIELKFADGESVHSELALTMLDSVLPEQTLLHTEWFHTDCLADFYGVEPWSEEHWRIVGNFLRHYAKSGMNMVLVPTFTPALDTAVGGERTTVQLMEVWEESEGTYRFGFERVKRYLDLCRQAGIRYVEMAHLFTQWGAKAAPKVMVWREGRLIKRFGWETPSDSADYMGFLEQYLTAVTRKLTEWGWEGHAFFHLSDEPEEQYLEHYGNLRSRIVPWLAPYTTMDALSEYSFYEKGAVDVAVPRMGQLPVFAEHKAKPLWTYYCGCHEYGTPNRHFAMPSSQIRMLGVLLYVYGVEGFLHWGYNFYNTAFSIRHIDPYAVTDAGGLFPSGDSFLVYPGADGMPEESLRMVLITEAMQDVRALQLLEREWGRERVLELIASQAGKLPTVLDYPRDTEFILKLRERVNREICAGR